MIRVTVTVTTYFDDSIDGPDKRTERLRQITEAIGSGLRQVDNVVELRTDSSADYIRKIGS